MPHHDTKNYSTIAYDMMVMDVDDEVRIRRAVVADKPWPIGPTT